MLIIRYIAPCHLSHSSTFFRFFFFFVVVGKVPLMRSILNKWMGGWMDVWLECVTFRLIKYIVPDPKLKWLSFMHHALREICKKENPDTHIHKINESLNSLFTTLGGLFSEILYQLFYTLLQRPVYRTAHQRELK